jgi:heme/copper-type cytochrome/quinol oxidase subunit 2
VLLAQAAAEPSLFGWYLGLGIAVLVVVIVVVVVGSILQSAARINRQAHAATDALDLAYRNTMPLWDVATINRSATVITEHARTGRAALGG